MPVRRAGPDDAEALALLRWAWRVTERGETGLDQAAFLAAMHRWTDEHRDTHVAWLAEVGAQAVGMGWMAIIDRVPSPAAPQRLAGNIQSVYVVAAHRGQGLGAQLVDALVGEGRQRGLEYIYLHSSEKAMPLYRRLGFKDPARTLELEP